MKSFLSECAKDLYSKESGNFHDICVVLPSKRAGKFFTQSLQSFIEKPVILPQIITVNDLFKELANVCSVENILLISKLFDVYKRNVKTEETFEEFVYWGQMLLDDFDDIDKYLVDPEAIFSNIESIKDIDKRFAYLTDEQISLIKRFWGTFVAGKLSVEQEALYQLWPKLLKIYQDFSSELLSRNIAYEGLAYRKVVYLMLQEGASVFKKSKYAFVGFNALNECEHKLFSFLKTYERAYFYWDVDPYYMNEDYNEAGFFVKTNIKRYPNELPSRASSRITGSPVEIVKAPSSVSQVKYVSQVIEEWVSRGIELSSCAIVLCDESLLLPLLYALPKAVTSVNITMGFPVKVTPAYTVLQLLLRLQKNCRNGNFLYQDIVELCKDPHLGLLVNPDTSASLVNINGHNFDRVNVRAQFEDPHHIFEQQLSGVDLLLYLKSICLVISKQLSKEEGTTARDISIESYYTMYVALSQVEGVMKEDKSLQTLLVAEMLVKQTISSLKVSFIGEPLAGIQIMGILESRVLNFEYVVMVSVNEGVLPSRSISPSYIPFNLRQGFGLPTVKQRDAIYAYYFYRLLQGAREVSLVYYAQASSENNSEVSRYVSQLMFSNDFHLKLKNISLSMQQVSPSEIEIVKTPDIMRQLVTRFTNVQKGLSATAINTFVDCELRFYYTYIACLKPEEEILDLPNQLEFGNIYHKAMQELYGQKVGEVIGDDWFDSVLNDDTLLERCIRKAFEETYGKGRGTVISGYKDVIYNTIKRYVKNILKLDKALGKLKILGLELEINNVTVPIPVGDDDHHVSLYGFLDRVDEVEGVTRIVDYKTGKKENNIGSVDSLFDSESSKRNGKAFQSLFYSYIYSCSRNVARVQPALYFVRESSLTLDSSIYTKTGKIIDFAQVEPQFLAGLKTVLSNLFDPNRPFAQNTAKCGFCDFNLMCNK